MVARLASVCVELAAHHGSARPRALARAVRLAAAGAAPPAAPPWFWSGGALGLGAGAGAAAWLLAAASAR